MDAIPSSSTIEAELLDIVNQEIRDYNMGPEDPNVPADASLKDRYPNQKSHDERYRILKKLENSQIAMIITKLYRACRICWLGVDNDKNYSIGLYQDTGDNRGIYDTREDTIAEIIRKYNFTIDSKSIKEVITAMENIAPKKVRCTARDLIPVNNGIFDYRNKILMDFEYCVLILRSKVLELQLSSTASFIYQ